ncbi:efflux transporter outer membrane subunit [Terrimicrobium sacchariphilum]
MATTATRLATRVKMTRQASRPGIHRRNPVSRGAEPLHSVKALRFLHPYRLALATSLMMTSCMVGPNFSTPEARIQGKWKKYDGISDRPPVDIDRSWWKQFHDSRLDSLIDTAYRNNPSLQAAGTRILGARAELNQSVGNLFPQKQDLILQGRGNVASDPNSIWTPSGLNENYLSTQALVSVSWEIDFWGKYRRQIQSDRAGYLATIAAYDSILVTLVADVASTYVNIRTLQARLAVNRANIAQQKKSVEVAVARRTAGRVGDLDVEQAKAQLATTEAEGPSIQTALQRAIDSLAVLLGETPVETERRVGSSGSIPTPPSNLAAGVPADLLRRRPDVRQAGLEAASRSARIGVEFAKILPSFSLNGTFGYTGGSENVSFSNFFNWQQAAANSAGSLVVPIFNYGRLVNQVRVADASFQEGLLNYQHAVLNAQREVQDALADYVNSSRRVAQLQAAVKAASSAVEIANLQYELGTADYARVLTAQSQRLAAEDALAQAKGQYANSLIAAYRAMGGGWELRNEAGVISPATRAQMASRTNWGNLLEINQHLPPDAASAPTPGAATQPAR